MKTPGLATLRCWFEGSHAAGDRDVAAPDSRQVDWPRVVPFLLLHASCLCAFWTGVSPVAIAVAVALFALRMFAITAFYHRYFSHRAFNTSRPAQFVFAVLGAMAVQRGPLWWAAHHRMHHAHADQPRDAHSPRQHGMFWSHTGWFLTRANFATRLKLVPDLACFPELRWLDRYDIAAPAALAFALLAAGAWLDYAWPTLGTSAGQMLVWGFCISTFVLYHATFSINSLGHRFGRRRYGTHDDSRNNLWLALLTLGEGWHNNHHHYPVAARQGFYWWEVDLSYYLLRGLAACGLIWNLRTVPVSVREMRP